MRARRRLAWSTFGTALSAGVILGLLAALGEVLHLAWFVPGVGFAPRLLLYAAVIDGGLGLVLGMLVGLPWMLWLRFRPAAPRRQTSLHVRAPKEPYSSRPSSPPLTAPGAAAVGQARTPGPLPEGVPGRTARPAITRRAALRLGVAAGSAAFLGAGALAWTTTGARHGGAGAAMAYNPLGDSGAAERPNVVLITLDTIRADFLGAYGNRITRTPSLDRLAAQGARFDLHMVQEPQTNPSHGSMFTGMYPSSSGIRVHMVDKLPPQLQTLSTVFAAAGYATAGLYSWLSFDPKYCGFQRGFQTYANVAGQKSTLLDHPVLRTIGADFRVAEEYLAAPRQFSRMAGGREQTEWTDKGRADVTTDAAIAQLQVLASQPFFLWVHYFDAHYPYVPPSRFAEQYAPGYNGPINSSMDVVDQIQNGKLDPQGADLQKLQGLYRGEISFLDNHLGRLLTALDRLDLSSKTVLALTADHGEAFGEHPQTAEGVDFFHPHSLHNEEQRTPLLLRYPGHIKAGSSVQAPTQAIDIFPTLLQLANVGVPEQAQGKSLIGLLDGSEQGTDRVAYGAMPDYTFTSVTVPGWKYIRNNANGGLQLFDLRSDVAESNDVSAAHSDLAKQLDDKAQAWMKAVNIS